MSLVPSAVVVIAVGRRGVITLVASQVQLSVVLPFANLPDLNGSRHARSKTSSETKLGL